MDRHEFEASLKAQSFDPGVEVDLPPNTVRAEHTHPFAVRALMLEGVLHLTCGGEERTYLPGDMFTMDLGLEHAERTEGEGARYLVGRKHSPG